MLGYWLSPALQNVRRLTASTIEYFITSSLGFFIGRFYTRGRIIRLDELGQTFIIRLVIQFVSGTSTRRIIRQDDLSFVVRRSSRTTEDSSSRRIMRLTLETNNKMNNECLPKFVQTDNVSSSIKTAISSFRIMRPLV